MRSGVWKGSRGRIIGKVNFYSAAVENKILVQGAWNTSPTELSKKERKLPGSSRKLPGRKWTITAVSGSIPLSSLKFP